MAALPSGGAAAEGSHPRRGQRIMRITRGVYAATNGESIARRNPQQLVTSEMGEGSRGLSPGTRERTSGEA